MELMIKDMKERFHKSGKVSLKWAPKKENNIVYLLACKGLLGSFKCWDHDFPSIVTDIHLHDILS